jgi:hypothetical protein
MEGLGGKGSEKNRSEREGVKGLFCVFIYCRFTVPPAVALLREAVMLSRIFPQTEIFF